MAFTVLPGPTVLPGGIPKNRWYNDLGRIYGRSYGKLEDAVLAFLTAGAYKGSNSKTNIPGSVTFPGGASQQTGTDPYQMGGGITNPSTVKNSYGRDIPVEALSQLNQPGGPSFTPPQQLSLRQLEAMQALANVQKTQSDAAYQQQLPGIFKEQLALQNAQQGTSAAGITPQHIQQIEDDAMAGDEEAVSAYNYLKRIGAV